MNKFTNIENVEIKHIPSINDRIKALLETLDITIVPTNKNDTWTGDITIEASEEFYNGLKSIINNEFTSEKVSILENARHSILTKDMSWLDAEMSRLKKDI